MVKIECKFKHGRFLPYGAVNPNASALENALDYVTHRSPADLYAFPAAIRGGKGRPGMARILVFTRAQVLTALQRYAASGQSKFGALSVHNGGIALTRYEYSILRQTFGAPIHDLDAELSSWNDLQPAAGCPNAPYARAFELVTARTMNGRHVGGLRGVQFDLYINEGDA